MNPDSGRIDVRGAIELARESDFAVGRLSVRPSASEVEIAGAVHKLEPRVMQVLVALARAGGAVVSRSDLIGTCWGGLIVGEDAINRVVSRLRRIADIAEPPAFRVDTIPKIGYRMILLETNNESASANGRQLDIGAGVSAPRRLRLSLLPPPALALAAVCAGIALFGLRLGPDAKTITPAATSRIAVLPPEVESAAEDQVRLAEGIVEEIHDRLTKFGGIEVIGLGSGVALGRVTDDAQELGRRLGASVILQGHFRRESLQGVFGRETEVLQFTFELIDTRNGAQLWVDSFRGGVSDVSRFEEEVLRGIAGALRLAVPASAKRPNISAGNPGAYDLYLQGLAALRRLQTRGEDGAVALLKRAVELDPTMSAARARLALAYAKHAEELSDAGNFAAHARTLNLSNETALEALAIEPDNAVALTALASVRWRQKRFQEAETLFNHARDIAPVEEAVIDLALQLASAGYVEEAKSLLTDAMAIHPADARLLLYLAVIEMLLGDYEEALKPAELAGSFDSFTPWPYLVSMAALGRADDAADFFSTAWASRPADKKSDATERFHRTTIGAFLDETGREDYVASIRESLDSENPKLAYVGAPQVLNLLGEAELRDRLFLYFIEDGYFDREPTWIMDLWAPWASNVRSTPQFKSLVVRMRFVPYWKARGWPEGCRPQGADDFVCG